MRKTKRREALKMAAKIADALKTSGAVPRDAKIEVRVCGQKQTQKKGGRESKPRGKSR
jgi:hypothetical protein